MIELDYRRFSVIYGNCDCQICCNWSRLKKGFKAPVHQRNMPQINKLISPPKSLDTDTGPTKSCSSPTMVNAILREAMGINGKCYPEGSYGYQW